MTNLRDKNMLKTIKTKTLVYSIPSLFVASAIEQKQQLSGIYGRSMEEQKQFVFFFRVHHLI